MLVCFVWSQVTKEPHEVTSQWIDMNAGGLYLSGFHWRDTDSRVKGPETSWRSTTRPRRWSCCSTSPPWRTPAWRRCLWVTSTFNHIIHHNHQRDWSSYIQSFNTVSLGCIALCFFYLFIFLCNGQFRILSSLLLFPLVFFRLVERKQPIYTFKCFFLFTYVSFYYLRIFKSLLLHSVALTCTKFCKFIPVYIVKIFTERFVHI